MARPIDPRRKAALHAGETHYHGEPCRRCGSTKRFSNEGKCVACRITNAKRWVENNPALAKKYALERSRRWRSTRMEELRNRARRRRAANPDVRARDAELARKWNRENKDRRIRNKNAWAAANPDKIRAIAQKAYHRSYHKDPSRWHENSTRRRLRGVTATPAWLRDSGQLDAMRALYAEAKDVGMSIDHDIPIAGCRICHATGLHVLANLQLLPATLNKAKNNRCMACFLQELRDAKENRAQANDDAEPQ